MHSTENLLYKRLKTSCKADYRMNKACSSSSLLLDGHKECHPSGMKPTTHLQLVPRLRMSGAIPLIPLHTFMVCKGTAHVEHAWLRRALSHAGKNSCERLANPRFLSACTVDQAG